MSDTPQEQPSPSSPSTSTIIQNMQQLTDIEGDLADTAIAVAALAPSIASDPAEAADATVQASPQQEQRGESNPVIQNAEAMESVLEQSIPDAPAPATIATSDTPVENVQTMEEEEVAAVQPDFTTMEIDSLPTDNQPQSNDIAPSTTTPAVPSVTIQSAELTIPTETSPVSAQATDAIQAVNADISEPILPENHIEPEPASSQTANDVLMKTENESTGKIETESTAPAATETIQVKIEHPAPISTLPPKPTLAVSETADVEVNGQDIKPEVNYPEGISVTSPSVISNPEIIHDWQHDPTNGHIILALFGWSIQRSEIADARAWYNALAIDDPTATQPLLDLINLESSLNNFPAVENLFARALKGPSGGITAAADVNIWKAYLHYIRRQNPVGAGGPEDEGKRRVITEAYEFALKQCGVDREAGEIWAEYIAFIQDNKPKNTWETQAQQDTVRKIYQRAVCIPLNNVEALWKAYDAFEGSVNKQTSKKFLAERSPAYMTARTALRELRNLTDPLPHPVLPPKPTFSEQDRQLVSGWKAYLKWEEINPLVISDLEVLASRIGYALRRCLVEMRHFPELWHYAANHYIKDNKTDEAAEVLRAGVIACPKSTLLTFATAEIEEERKNFSEAHLLFSNLLDAISTETDTLQETIKQEVIVAKGPEIPKPQDGGMDVDGEGPQATYNRLMDEREERGRTVEERRGREVGELQMAMGVIWVMYMRYARRAEGIKAARAVFGKARKSPHVTWHIFEASAMMEYHINKDSAVAIRIFELGFKLFSEDVDYVVRYLQFLLNINDDTNARALFERSALKIPADKARPLWDAWARYEYMYGDLGAVQKLENRFSEVFPGDSPLKRFAQRYTYNGIDQIARRDLGFGGVQRAPQQSAPQFTPQQSQQMAPPPALPPFLAPQPPIADRAPIPLPAAPINPSPTQKRPLPPSPTRLRGSIERSHSPGREFGNKRYRPNSPPPPPARRFEPPPPRDRGGSASRGYGPPPGRDRSPLPMQHGLPMDGRSYNGPTGTGPGYGGPPGQGQGQRNVSGGPNLPPIPSQQGMGHSPFGAPQPPRDGWDRSGVSRGLAWFVGQLPSARSFDGPVFRPDDIMGLFSNIGPDGLRSGGPSGNPPPIAMSMGGGGYNEPPRGYGGAPPPRRY